MALATTARAGLATWFAGALGYPVFWANQDMPRPAKPFGQIQVTVSDVPDGVAASADEKVRSTTTAGKLTSRFFRTHVISLQVFTDDTTGATRADVLLGTALQKLNLEADRAALVAAGVRVQTVGSVRDLTSLLPTRPESRAQCDVTVSTVDTLDETGNYIAEVIGETTVAPTPKRTFDVT